MLLSIYRKPAHSDKHLNFHSWHSISVKRRVVIFLVDRAFRIYSWEFQDSELLYLRGILYGYPINFINKIVKNRRIKHDFKTTAVSQSSELNLSKSCISLLYHMCHVWEENLNRFYRNITLVTYFQTIKPLSGFINFAKDLPRGNLISGV